MTDNDGMEEAEAAYNHALMSETEDYLHRGRRFSALATGEIQRRWVVAMKALFSGGDGSRRRDMDDLAAEMRLRQVEPPYDQVEAAIALITESLGQSDPDQHGVRRARPRA